MGQAEGPGGERDFQPYLFGVESDQNVTDVLLDITTEEAFFPHSNIQHRM
jgi:hypothetical protein